MVGRGSFTDVEGPFIFAGGVAMNREGFTLIEVILLLFLISILIMPAFSVLNAIGQTRSRASELQGEVNGVWELVERIYYEEPVKLLEGVEYRKGRLGVRAVALENEGIAEERLARERRGENLYEYRRLDVEVRVYSDGKLRRELELYRFGLLTEAEREYYERAVGVHGR